MSQLLEDIRTYCRQINEKIDIASDEQSLAKGIARYAHRNQKRENGEPYWLHPYRCAETFRSLLRGQDPAVAESCGIPVKGVECLCLLHDVVEDTPITASQIKSLFAEAGYLDYFLTYIETPLDLLTHRKGERYQEYIDRLKGDPRASLVKIIDMHNNLLVLTSGRRLDYFQSKMNDYLSFSFSLSKAQGFHLAFASFNEKAERSLPR